MNARYSTETLDVAFELIEMRTGLGLKPLYGSGRILRGGREAIGSEIQELIDRCRGKMGKEKRWNAQRLKEEFAEAWSSESCATCVLGKVCLTVEMMGSSWSLDFRIFYHLIHRAPCRYQ